MANPFDFLDLQGNTGAWEAAGSAAQGVQQGQKAGADMAARDYQTLAQWEEMALRKKGPEKDAKYYLELVQAAQAANTTPVQFNDDDLKIAASEVLGERFEKGAQLSEADAMAIEQRAMQVANASIPELDVRNPLPWLQARISRSGLRSDAEEKAIAGERAERLNILRQDRSDQRQANQLRHDSEKTEKTLGETARRLEMKLYQDRSIHRDKLSQRQAEQRRATAEKRKKELDSFIASTGKGKIQNKEKAAKEFLSKLKALKDVDADIFNQAVEQHRSILDSDAVRKIRMKQVSGNAPTKVEKIGKTRFINDNGVIRKVKE